MKLTAATSEFLQSLEAEGRSPHTTAAYRRDLAVFAAFAGNLELDAVTPALLQRFMADHSVQVAPSGAPRAKASVNRYRVTLKALFGWAEARWLVPRNPTAILKCRRHRGLPPQVLTQAEVERVITFPYTGRHAERDRAIITFMLTTGCRLGETVELDTRDIDTEQLTATLRTPKGGDPERVPLSQKCLTVLDTCLDWDTQESRPLFRTRGDQRISRRQVQRIVVYRMQEAGITKPITAHTLRHTFATRLYNQTGDIRLVQTALRHEHLSTTEVYAHLDPVRLRQAVNAPA
jgi:site-specific recombinase XerD